MKAGDYIVDLINESARIILNPRKHWRRVKAETDFVSGGFKRFFVAGLVLVLVTVLLGDLLFESEYGFLFKDSLIKAGRKMLVLTLSLFASNMLIYEVSRRFRVPVEFDTSRKIAIYSMLPLLLVVCITSLFPFLDIVGVLAFYSLYLVYIGLVVLYDIKIQRNLVYVFILLSSIFVAYVLIAYLLSKLTALIIY